MVLIGIYDKFKESYKVQDVKNAAKKNNCETIHVHQSSLIWNRDSVALLGLKTIPNVLFVSNLGRDSPNRANYRLKALNILNSEIPVVNSPNTIALTRSKVATTLQLQKWDIPSPTTWITEKPEDVVRLLEEHSQLVLKADVSSRGEGIFLLDREKPDIYTFLEHFSRHFSGGVFLVQELILPKEEDYRVLTIGEQIIGSVCRRLVDDSGLTTNIAQGGIMESFMDEMLDTAALAINKKLALGFYAFDFVRQDDQYLLLEINSCSGWSGFKQATGISVGEKLVEFLIRRNC